VEGLPREVIRADVLSGLYGSPIEVVETQSGRLIVVGTPDEGGHH
jgi:zinc/manganese transport system ATP-binding protein